MSKRTDQIIERSQSIIKKKIEELTAKLEEYTDYQRTFGGYRYESKITDIEEDLKTLNQYRKKDATISEQSLEIMRLNNRIHDLEVMLGWVSRKVSGCGMEIVIEQINKALRK